MMFPRSALFLAASLAGLSSFVSAAPLAEKRQTPANCAIFASGYLIVRPTSNASSGPITYVGIVPNVKHTGIDGQSDSIIVTKDNSGNALQPQLWAFLTCEAENGQSPPPGYKPPTSGPSNNYFGILRPQNSTQHCLSLESTNDVTVGARNSVVDAHCTAVPEQYRTFMYVDYIYGNSADASNLFFADQSETIVIGNTAHAELQFLTNYTAPAGTQTYQLQLLPNQLP